MKHCFDVLLTADFEHIALSQWTQSLTHYSLVLLFYTPGKHEKRFYDVFSGYGKATPGCNGLNWMYISHMNLWFVFSLDFLSIKFLCFHILARNCGDDNKKKRDRNKQMFKTVWQLSKLRPFTWALRSVHNSNELGHNVCVRVCVCVCVYVHSPWRFHLSGSVGMPGNRSTMLCWRRFFLVPSPFIASLEWSTKPF